VTGHLLRRAAIALLAAASLGAGSSDPRVAEAARRRDAAAVRALIRQGVEVRATLPDGATALHWAAYWGDADLVSHLIRAGASADARNDLGVTPLALACLNGNLAIVEALLAAGADPNGAQPTGETALMTAARAGSAAVVTALLDRGAGVNAKEPTRGQTALMWAASEQHPDVIRVLIKRGADVHARSTTGFTALLFAARDGDVDTARSLLEGGARPNDASGDGLTPLLVATVRGRTAFAEFLLDHGADPNLKTAGYTALHWAAGTWVTQLTGRFGITAESKEWGALGGLRGATKLAFVRQLLAHGADPNDRVVKTPPLFGTSFSSHCTANCGRGIGLPLNHSLNNVLGVNLDGATPLLLAAEAGDAAVMRALLDAGADPSLVSKEKTTPLMLAAGLSWTAGQSLTTEDSVLEAVKVALAAGNDVNAVSEYGDTALHGAARSGMNSVIQFLVDNGARVDARNKWGETPLLITEGGGRRLNGELIVRSQSAELLRKLGARE
jgi:ankyrin repeat protein